MIFRQRQPLMGEVKESVTGGGPAKKHSGSTSFPEGMNLKTAAANLQDEIAKCINIKEKDVESEGDALKAENQRKVGQLRAAFSLIKQAKQILEDMY